MIRRPMIRRRPAAPRLLGPALAMIMTLAATMARADYTSFDASLGAAYDGNVSRSPGAADRRGDSLRSLHLGARRSIIIDEHSGATLGGGLTYEDHQRFAALDKLSALAELSYTWQPVGGYATPWYEASGSLERLQFADSALRNGTQAGLLLSAATNVTDRIQMKAGLGLNRRWAQGEVYDMRWRQLFGEASYQLPSATAYLRFTRLAGDQVFSARSGTAAYWPRAEAEDEAFGAGYEAYRLGATANLLDLGMAMPLGSRDGLVAGVARYIGRADAGGGYGDTQWRIGWRHRFD